MNPTYTSIRQLKRKMQSKRWGAILFGFVAAALLVATFAFTTTSYAKRFRSKMTSGKVLAKLPATQARSVEIPAPKKPGPLPAGQGQSLLPTPQHPVTPKIFQADLRKLPLRRPI